MNITTVGIDLAKLGFQVHAVNDRGKMMLRKAFKRADLIKFFANLAPCLIGMEACGGAHFRARTAQSNQIRGLLAEFGLVIPKNTCALQEKLPEILEDAENSLPGTSRDLFARLLDHFRELDRQVKELEAQIKAWLRQSEASKRLEAVPGIGPLTASALVASVGDAKSFKSGRQLAAWLGLVPRQMSSGGKERLLGISKRGDTYLRTLLIHGARSVLFHLRRRSDPAEGWLARLTARPNPNIAAVTRVRLSGRPRSNLDGRRLKFSASTNHFLVETHHELHRRFQRDGDTGQTGVDST